MDCTSLTVVASATGTATSMARANAIVANEIFFIIIPFIFFELIAQLRRTLLEQPLCLCCFCSNIRKWKKEVFRGGTMDAGVLQHGSQTRMTQISPCHPCLRSLRCYAEDAPQSVVELEGRLRAIQVITRHTPRTTSAVHGNSVHMIRRTVTLLRDRKSTRLNSSNGYISYGVF